MHIELWIEFLLVALCNNWYTEYQVQNFERKNIFKVACELQGIC